MSILTASLLVTHADAVKSTRRGFMAFHYASPLTEEQLDWYSRFDLLVTHDPLPAAQVAELHRRGTRLLLYEWSVAFYPSISGSWHRSLPSSALLNERPLRGHLGAADADAHYYDPLSPEHVEGRAAALEAKLRGIGYDGLFLDTTTAQSVHPEALAEFERRHPGSDYDVEFARFLARLRLRLKDGVIATNQGYRAAAEWLPHADVDVTESLVTRPVDGRWEMRPWYRPTDQWNSISFLMERLIVPAQRRFPTVRFVHLNYVDELEPEAITWVLAIARLYDAEAFVADPDLAGGGSGESYFEDFGAPAARVEVVGGKAAYRLFERGIVFANFGTEPLEIPNGPRSTYEDVVTGERSSAARIVVAAGRAGMLRRR
jgi:hypothetical protein